MMVTSVASSHHSGSASIRPSSTTHEKTKATVIAREMRVIIPGSRLFSSPQALLRKTSPPYRKTIVPSVAGRRLEPGKLGAW